MKQVYKETIHQASCWKYNKMLVNVIDQYDESDNLIQSVCSVYCGEVPGKHCNGEQTPGRRCYLAKNDR